MYRTAIVFLLLFFGTAYTQAEEITAEVRGVRVVGDGHDTRVRPFNWSKGTSVAIFVSRPAGGLISFDKDASSVSSFEDDTGTNLLSVGSRSFFGKPGFTNFASISEDGTAVSLEINSSVLPSKGTKNIKAKGEIVVKAAREKTVVKSTVASSLIGEKIQVGNLSFEVTKLGKPNWSNSGMTFSLALQTTDDISALESISFLDENGNRLESEKSSTMSGGFMGKKTSTRQYNFKLQPAKFIIEATMWADMKEIRVPFDLEAGLGL